MSTKQKTNQKEKAVKRVKPRGKKQPEGSLKKQVLKIVLTLMLIIVLALAVAILEGTTNMNLTTVQIWDTFLWIDWPEFYQFLLKPIIFIVIIMLFGLFVQSLYKYFKIEGVGIGYKP